MPSTGKELSKIPVGTPVLYEHNPDSNKVKQHKWWKITIKDSKEPRKWHILMDKHRIVTRSRHHIKSYFTHSGRVSKGPNRLIESCKYCEAEASMKEFAKVVFFF